MPLALRAPVLFGLGVARKATAKIFAKLGHY